MRPLLRILALWRGRGFILGLGALIALASLGAGVALLGVSGGLVAGVILGAAVAAPMTLRLLGPLRVALRYAERLATHDATFRALADLRVWFFRGLALRSAGGLGFRRGGDVLARLVNDVEALDGLYLRILVPLAGAAMLLPVLLAVLLPLDATLALAVGALFLLAAFVMPLVAGYAVAGNAGRLAQAGAALRIAGLDAVAGLREVRAFGAEGRMVAAMQAREAVLHDAQRAQMRHGALAGAGAFLCAQAAILLVLLRVHASGATTAAAACTAAFLTVAAFEAIALLPRAGVLGGRAAAAARRVLEAAETGPASDPTTPARAAGPAFADPSAPGRAAGPVFADPSAPARAAGPVFADPSAPARAAGAALRFEGVTFRWQPDRPVVFDGLTMEVPQGSRVALLGPSGSGKSTLAALALKVVTPQSGRITLGGVDIATLPAASVRARIGWLSQSTHLFADTIRANLLLARAEASEAELWAALDAARIGETVRALPGGLDAWVGEGGTGFSGGQGRRLALARALLAHAPVLILDEPCAGLDAETERAFLATLNDIGDDRSIILIAHRLTGIERLDRIWRLSAGHAVAAAA